MNELTTTQDTQISTSPAQMIMNPVALQSLVTFADMMAKSVVTVPKHLQGKPADCMAIAMQAMRWGMDPFVVAQKTHIVNGTLGYEAQLVNAVAQSSGAIQGGFSYGFRGEGLALECRVGAVLRGQGEITWGEWLKSSDVKTKNSPLWQVNPKQQMGYLQVKNWARLYCPGAILGVYTDDELEDFTPPPSNKDMGHVEEVKPERPALEPYSAEQFAANLPTWRSVIESGRKTPDQIIDMVETKATLTQEQKNQIYSAVEPAETVDADGVIHGAQDQSTQTAAE